MANFILLIVILHTELLPFVSSNNQNRIKNSYEKRRAQLGIDSEPHFIEFPIATIRGPVTWKCNFQIARNRIDQVLMVNHPVLQAINYLWHQL